MFCGTSIEETGRGGVAAIKISSQANSPQNGGHPLILDRPPRGHCPFSAFCYHAICRLPLVINRIRLANPAWAALSAPQ